MPTKWFVTLAAVGGLYFLFGSMVQGSTVWTEESKQDLPLSVDETDAVNVRTDNGHITYQGDASKKPQVTVTMKTGGATAADAEEALAAVEVFIERGDNKTSMIGWRWNKPRKDSWSARVSFAVAAPPRLFVDAGTHNGTIRVDALKNGLTAKTHNGALHVTDVRGDVVLDVHNAAVEVESANGSLACSTHNGKISAVYSGDTVRLTTHNGKIDADLSSCGAVGGTLSTHNGPVTVIVGADTSANLKCSSRTGIIACDAELQSVSKTKRSLYGVLGDGGTALTVKTFNGAIEVRQGR